MEFKHEAVEMDPSFFLERNRVVKQIHQECFAAPHTAPQIKTADPIVGATVSSQAQPVP